LLVGVLERDITDGEAREILLKSSQTPPEILSKSSHCQVPPRKKRTGRNCQENQRKRKNSNGYYYPQLFY
jgi:hypothetical protein